MPALLDILSMMLWPPSSVTGFPYWVTINALVFLLIFSIKACLNGRYFRNASLTLGNNGTSLYFSFFPALTMILSSSRLKSSTVR
ncbi:MAG: hypothetical protein M1129_03385 [Candidatus Thermoplasmatota archaeon]|nr:hypothetical protein [Candidatus Thermoplasmatota archaeon]MCL5954918.1 hypothetical protein [Candidatus Thermoplasmatota archaeon]